MSGIPGPHNDGPTGRGGALSGGEFAGIGLQFALVILIFTGLGYWLDKRLGSSPWFLLVFVFIGAAAGFYSMVSKVTAAQKRDADRRKTGSR